MTKEKIDLKSPPAIAMEIAAVIFLTWKLKNKYDRRDEAAGKPEPYPYPMNETVGDTDVYFYPSGEGGSFSVGSRDPVEGYIEVQGVQMDRGDGEPEITIDESATDPDPSRLEILRARITEIHQVWRDRAGD